MKRDLTGYYPFVLFAVFIIAVVLGFVFG